MHIELSTDDKPFLITVFLTPTNWNCHLWSIIGLCVFEKLKQDGIYGIQDGFPKVEVKIREGSHTTSDDLTKQLNDKERRTAAMENPDIRNIVMACIQDND